MVPPVRPHRGAPGSALKKRLEIEPLSDARWSRVERAVLDSAAGHAKIAGVARAGAPRTSMAVPLPRWRLAGVSLVLAGALATVTGALAWRTLLPEPRAAATRVETAANGSRVEFGESTIDVGPESTVQLTGDAVHGVVVVLEKGRVECDVAPRRGRAPFVVDAGPVEVRVVGTHFEVDRRDGKVSVDVQRGTVEVASGGARTSVEAGSHWPAPPPSAPAPADVPALETAPAGPAGAAGAVSPRPGSLTGAAPSPGPSRGGPVLSPRDEYESASRLEARQPDAALGVYRDLARQGGAWGKNALFAEGRLEADRGNEAQARTLLHEYLTRYPTGPNAGDARHLLDRLR